MPAPDFDSQCQRLWEINRLRFGEDNPAMSIWTALMVLGTELDSIKATLAAISPSALQIFRDKRAERMEVAITGCTDLLRKEEARRAEAAQKQYADRVSHDLYTGHEENE